MPNVSQGSEHVMHVQTSDKHHSFQEGECSTSQAVEDVPANHSYHEAPILEPAAEMQAQMSPNSPLGESLLCVSSTVENEPGREHCPSTQVSQSPIELSASCVDLQSQSLSRTATDSLYPLTDVSTDSLGMHSSEARAMSNTSEINNNLVQGASVVASQAPYPVYPDPLQNELERLSKETNHTIKVHEATVS